MNIYLFLFLVIMNSFSTNENQLNDEFVLKAALIQKLAIFIEWGENNKNDKFFRIATIGSSKFAKSVKENLSNLKVNDKSIEVKDYSQYTDEYINFLILGNISSNDIEKILTKIDKNKTIVITDDKSIKLNNFHIFIYIKEGKLSFKINRQLLKNESIKISYHVLKYAEIVGN